MWSIKSFRKATFTRDGHRKEIEEKLQSFTPEDQQKVRAYLSINPGDEAFIRQLLGSTREGNR